MHNEAMNEALQHLRALIEAAHTGLLVPVRLPGQLETIETLLLEASRTASEELTAQIRHDNHPDAEEQAEFFKTAIHELRTPMTSIRGYSDMLSNETLTGELNDMQRQLLDVVRANSRRMENLLSDMGYLNKIRAGVLKTSIKMDMFKNIAMMVEKDAQPIANELNRQLVFIIPQGLPLLNTDGELLAHAIVKLVENGLRYSQEGEGQVTIQAEDQQGYLVVAITDNGIGMSSEELAHLGEVFFRADHDLVRSYTGSGLGVAIAYGIITALDGQISVDSAPGQGTEFTIRLKGLQ